MPGIELVQPIADDGWQLTPLHLIQQELRRETPAFQVFAVCCEYLGHDVLDQHSGIELLAKAGVTPPEHVNQRIIVEWIQPHSIVGAEGRVAGGTVQA